MKHNIIRYSMMILVIGFLAIAAGGANAQSSNRNEIHIESYSWGITSGQIARVSGLNFVFMDGSVRSVSTAIMRIQLLDMEGEVIAQSDEIRVEPGQSRFWDAPRGLLPATGDPTGRIQVRARIIVMTEQSGPGRNKPPLSPSVEIIDAGTGRTVMIFDAFLIPPTIDAESE